MKEITKGSFCISKTGHDANTLYYVKSVSDMIYVCDGRIRTLANPKKKNPKHLQVLNYTDADLQKLETSGMLRDEHVKYAIKKLSALIKQEGN